MDTEGNIDKAIWQADLNRLADALRPYTETIDGELFISHDAPRELSDIYARIVSVGYANGFMP